MCLVVGIVERGERYRQCALVAGDTQLPDVEQRVRLGVALVLYRREDYLRHEPALHHVARLEGEEAAVAAHQQALPRGIPYGLGLGELLHRADVAGIIDGDTAMVGRILVDGAFPYKPYIPVSVLDNRLYEALVDVCIADGLELEVVVQQTSLSAGLQVSAHGTHIDGATAADKCLQDVCSSQRRGVAGDMCGGVELYVLRLGETVAERYYTVGRGDNHITARRMCDAPCKLIFFPWVAPQEIVTVDEPCLAILLFHEVNALSVGSHPEPSPCVLTDVVDIVVAQAPFVFCVVGEMSYACAVDAVEAAFLSSDPNASALVLEDCVDALGESYGCGLQAARRSDVSFQIEVTVINGKQTVILPRPYIAGVVYAQCPRVYSRCGDDALHMPHAEVHLREAVLTGEPEVVLAVDEILLYNQDTLSGNDVVVKRVGHQRVAVLIVIAEGAAGGYHPYCAVLVLMKEGRRAGGELLWRPW